MFNLQERDLTHIWHPCSQMKDYETFKPLPIKYAKDCRLYLHDETSVIDATSSWWCKPLGHQHPSIKAALIEQANQFEHTIFANTTNETIVKLSENLCDICRPLSKVAYASDGSCAVEMAMKMSLHSRVIEGKTQKQQFAALKNGYHGETALTLSVSDLGLYKAPYQAILQTTHFIEPIPYVTGPDDPLWNNASQIWYTAINSLEPIKHTLTAVIVEPILQGAGGMKIYSADFLRRLSHWCQENDIHLIADEIMTGLGRTGKLLACHYADIIPDFICLSKNLTAGWLPLSAMLTHQSMYDLFYDDYETQKAFMHSHTHSGNVLAAAVANQFLEILLSQNYCQQSENLAETLRCHMQSIANNTNALTHIRALGSVVAADLINPNNIPRLGYQIYQAAVARGALLRPLGNTLYWLLPFNTTEEILDELKTITQAAIIDVLG